jgi:hypothetical protein
VTIRSRARLFRTLALSAALAAASACDDSPTEPTDPNITETFASFVHRNGSATRAFEVTAAGSIQLTLVSLAASDTSLGIGIGTGGEGGAPCTFTETATVTPVSADGEPQLSRSVGTGRFCVGVYDVGQLTGTTAFSLEIVRPR